MENVMFLSYNYELLRNKNLEIGVYICQGEKKRKRCAAEVCVREILKNPELSIMVLF